jgi:uncharacterized protein YcbX
LSDGRAGGRDRAPGPADAAALTIAGLFVYPLKSAAGSALDHADLDAFGIRHDRRWMVVRPDGRFITQRDSPRMALVRATPGGAALRLTAPGTEPLDLPIDGPGPLARRVSADVWEGPVGAADAGDAAADWITAALGQPARIVHMPDDVTRPVHPRYTRDRARVSFADGFPLLLIGQASLDGLNVRLVERSVAPLPMNRFRPNIVVAGGAPHAEDGWRVLRVGDVPGVVLHVVKPCARCVVTTIEQTTGVAGREPLRTLATYRRGPDGGVLFGQNAIHAGPGRLSIGDPVAVLEGASGG